jgi:alpha-ketoglutarate-dependent taurine dioxygenase
MKLLCDGWCAEYDIKLKHMPKNELQDLFKDIYKYHLLNFKNQNLTANDFLRIAECIGSVQRANPSEHERNSIWESDGVLRVGGDEITGKPSLFSHEHDLDWHANQPSNVNRKELIWLYALTGSKGSRTSWINNAWAYADLQTDIKNKLENLYVYCGFKSGRYSDTNFFKEHVNKNNPVKLVRTFGEHKGLFFPFFQIFEVVDYDHKEGQELIEYLQNHILNEKYMFHLDWNDGDVNVAEQILTIHKRWKFDGMGKRILWRIASGHEQIANTSQ